MNHNAEELFQILSEFIECWMHTILYMRQIYPPGKNNKQLAYCAFKSCSRSKGTLQFPPTKLTIHKCQTTLETW